MQDFIIDGYVSLGVFDFDGNILAPETITYVIDRRTGEEVGLTNTELDQNPDLIHGDEAQYRWKENIEESFIHSRDFHSDKRHLGPNHFKKDIENAIAHGAFAPSLEKLKDLFLIPARFFAIISGRGHSADNFARILGIINDAILSTNEKEEQYKNINHLYHHLYPTVHTPIQRDEALRFYFEYITAYYPTANPHLAKYIGYEGVSATDERKIISMEHLLGRTRGLMQRAHIDGYPLSIGFSDDSLKNIETMMEFFTEKRKNGTLHKDTVHLYFTGKQGEAKKLQKDGVNIEFGEKMSTIRI